MEHSPLRRTQSYNHSGRSSSSKQQNEMAMLTATPTLHAPFHRDHYWSAPRSPPYRSTDNESKISLPSIRMAFPELQLPSTARDNVKSYSTNTSPTSVAPGPQTSPAYVHSPGTMKRRRDSIEDEEEAKRARQIPRMYHSPEQPLQHRAPSPSVRAPNRYETWAPSQRSPFTATRSSVMAPVDTRERAVPRLTIPRHSPVMSTDVSPVSSHRVEEHQDSYPGPSHPQQSGPPSGVEQSARYAPDFSYRHTAPAPAPVANHHPYERAPFVTTPVYEHPQPPPQAHYQDYARYPDLGRMVVSADSKQRKRRGNLPKETTDKLRAWFIAHLAHPYPTEDEKQELMRQTGLQMNQISNWFINARRRQLPTMISNARVETDATSLAGRAPSAPSSVDGKTVLATTERPDFHHGPSHPHHHPHAQHHYSPHHHHHPGHGKTVSNGELNRGSSTYDEEFEILNRQRAVIKRGSV